MQKHESVLRGLIDAEFAKLDLLLDLRLDKLVRELSDPPPALYADYQAARRHLRSRQPQPRGSDCDHRDDARQTRGRKLIPTHAYGFLPRRMVPGEIGDFVSRNVA